MQVDPSKDPQVQELTAQTRELVALAGTYQVATTDAYAGAGEDLKRVNAALARLEAVRKGMTAPLDLAKKAIMDFFRGPTEQLQTACTQIKRAMVTFSDEQERQRREAQRKLEDKARLEREESERKARELEARAAAERAAGNERAAARLETRAATAQETAATVVAPVLQAAVPKVVGVTTRTVWKYRIKDANKVPREYLSLDEKKIAGVVRVLKADTRIDGIEVYEERELAASRVGAA